MIDSNAKLRSIQMPFCIKKHFTYYLGVKKLLKSFFLFLFCSVMSMEGVVVSLYPFNIF